MGSRGAFVNVNMNDFSFVEGGQHYLSLGTLSSNSNVKILIQDSNNVKAPEFSHTKERIYAIIKDGKLKHLSYYDENHKQIVSIDLAHAHKGVQPHKHENLKHGVDLPGIPPTDEELALIEKIKREFSLK